MLSDRCLSCLSVPSITLMYCSQTVGWIKNATWYGGRPRPRPHCIRRGPSSPRGHSPPISGLCLLRPNGWMDQDAICYGRRPRPKSHCVRLAPSSPKRGTSAPPHSRKKEARHPTIFGPCLLWQKRLDGPRCHLVRR